ncbi:MAG: spore cortex biosynthesis protein YabQ [Ruminococcus sp.]|nr:spore cortex biosynthesis protein YabQ [Ruminococcus sp.]
MEKMQLGLELETQLFLLSVLIGFAMGAVYDIFRMVRIATKSGRILTFVCDVVYTVLFWFVLFTFCTGLTGQIRVFALFGMLTGAVMERLSLGNLAVRAFGRLWRWLLRKIFAPLKGFITKLIRKIRSLFVKIA